MRINYKNLKLLLVETKSGIILGKIKDFILETESQNVLQYEVGGMIGKKYLISCTQVINIDEGKMIVEDNVGKIENKNEIEKIKNKIEMKPVMMDETVN